MTDADGPDRAGTERLLADPLHTAHRDGGPLRDGPFRNPCGAKDLDLMPGHGQHTLLDYFRDDIGKHERIDGFQQRACETNILHALRKKIERCPGDSDRGNRVAARETLLLSDEPEGITFGHRDVDEDHGRQSLLRRTHRVGPGCRREGLRPCRRQARAEHLASVPVIVDHQDEDALQIPSTPLRAGPFIHSRHVPWCPRRHVPWFPRRHSVLVEPNFRRSECRGIRVAFRRMQRSQEARRRGHRPRVRSSSHLHRNVRPPTSGGAVRQHVDPHVPALVAGVLNSVGRDVTARGGECDSR
jgi:hypothetical protein